MKKNQLLLLLAMIALAAVGAGLGYRGVQRPRTTVDDTPSMPMPLPATPNKTANPISVSQVFDELKEAASRRDRATIQRVREGWIARCSRKQLDELIDIVRGERDTVFRGTMMEAIAGRWAMFDPKAAIDFMTNEVHRENRQVGLPRIFEILASKDPANAFTLIAQTSEAAGHPANMQPATEAVFAEWKKRDPSAAVAAVGTLEDAGQRWSALHALCAADNDGERELVFDNIRAVEDSELRRDAWKQAIGNWAEQAPFDTVIDWIGEQTFEGNLASRLERQAAVEHGEENPKQMAEWLVARADGDSLPGHLSAAVQFWADDQPNACGAWLHEIGLGPHTDRAVETFAYTILQHDAQSAFAWAQAIQDKSKRGGVLQDVSHHFYRFNPAGFLKTVAASELPAAEQSALVEKVKKGAQFR
ncbi:MAG: hypothetical protein ACI9R3_002043 [Verrucomicrobiales bacterium]|jgi:hypothetical protein